LEKCEEVQSFRVFDLEKNNAKYEVEDVEVKGVVVRSAQTDVLDKQTEDLQRRRGHLLERLRSQNANMASELGMRKALLTPCRRNIENIPQTTRRLFDTSMIEVAKRLRETKQSWVNTQSLCDSESAFQRMEDVLAQRVWECSGCA